MLTKAVLFVCAQAFLIQSISSQCIGSAYNAYDGLAWGASPWDNIGPYGTYGAPLATGAWPASYATEWAPGCAPAIAASSGGGFIITSASPIAPTGVAVTSENAYEGALAVSGALPFLGAVALEGPLPTLGAGAVTYGCGNGNVAILNEEIGAAAFGPYGAYGAYGPAAELGYGAYGAYGPAAELGYGYGTAPLAYEAAIAGPAYGYRGCGYGPVY